MEEITCKQAQLWFTFLMDGVHLSDLQFSQLENHLKFCNTCQTLFDEEKQLEELINSAMENAARKHISSEKLIDFLDGRTISEFEQKIIQTHLKNCQLCQDAYEKLEALGTIQKEVSIHSKSFLLKRKIKRILRGILTALDYLIRPRVLIPATSAVAILLALFFAYNQFFKPPSLPELAEIEPYPFIEIQIRGGNVQLDELQQSAMRHYKNEEYEQAISQLTQILKIDSTRFIERFYLAVSYLMAGKTDSSRAHFQELLSTPLLADKSHWYLAQIYLLKNQKEKALNELNRLIALKTPHYFEKAKRLKQKILALNHSNS